MLNDLCRWYVCACRIAVFGVNGQYVSFSISLGYIIICWVKVLANVCHCKIPRLTETLLELQFCDLHTNNPCWIWYFSYAIPQCKIHAECSDIHLFIVVTFICVQQSCDDYGNANVHSHMMIKFNSHMMIMVLLELKSCICHIEYLLFVGKKGQAFILDKQGEL